MEAVAALDIGENRSSNQYVSGVYRLGPESDLGARETCGSYNGEWFDERCHIAPAPEDCAERFRFHSSGHISGDGTPEAGTMIEKLNLNHRELVSDRQVMVEWLDERLMTDDSPEPLLRDFLDVDDEGARPGFANVAIGYLKEQTDTRA